MPAVDEESLLAKISQMLSGLQKMTHTIPIQHRILRQLIYGDYNDMRSRRTQILSADSDTCGWILEYCNDGHKDDWDRHRELLLNSRVEASKSFRRWLREGQDILHISGNAGAGKSTLMKFIASHDTTTKELKKWAGAKTLVKAEFYFYSSGTILQRTLAGLYRSLLFEVLRHCPGLMAEVFPRQWKCFETSAGDRTAESMHFGDEDIKAAFENLVGVEHENYKFLFFIDGLDEYQGTQQEHYELAHRLMHWTESKDIKICTSSRPYTEYLELFRYPQNPTIHLHLLNQPDIRTYCFNRFEKYLPVSKFEEYYEDLIDEIAKNSQGVFLWAYLVVDILLIDMRSGRPREALLKKLREVPLKLEELYDSLRMDLSKSDRIVSDKMLLLAVMNPFDKPLEAINFAWLEPPDDLADPQFPCLANSPLYSEKDMEMLLDRARKMVANLTRGLLEVVKVGADSSNQYLGTKSCPCFYGNVVQFFHRTAKDYILESPKRMEALHLSFPTFVETRPYLGLRLAAYLRVYGHPCTIGARYLRRNERHKGFELYIGKSIRELEQVYPGHTVEIAAGYEAAIRRRIESPDDSLRGVPHQKFLRPCQPLDFFSSQILTPVSLVHLMANFYCNSYVLSEMARDTGPKQTAKGLNLFISATAISNWKLVDGMLDQGIELNDLCSIWTDIDSIEADDEANNSMEIDDEDGGLTEIRNKYPVWFLAVSLIISEVVYYMDPRYSHSLTPLRRLVNHGICNGGATSVSFKCWGRPLSEEIDVPITDLVEYFDMRKNKVAYNVASFSSRMDSSTCNRLHNIITSSKRTYDCTLSNSFCGSLPVTSAKSYFVRAY